ncbi:MAG: CDP-2,3-bis-(O-geranylgeranyl)-sn-glycerol synthase, partial [Candidatus Altarchaeaceae archaeon]
MFSFIIEGIWFILPAYFASASAVIFGKFSKIPIDLNKNFIDGRRIFGESKTISGFFGGIFTGTFVAYIQSIIQNFFDFIFVMDLFYGFLISFGALFGDLCNSFLKRRLNKKPGEKFFPWDQLNLLIGALIFASIIKIPSINAIIFLIFFTIIMHLFWNYVAFKLKLK